MLLKSNRRIGGQRRSIHVPNDMKAYNPQRENAFQLAKAGTSKKSIHSKSTRSYKSAHSLSRKLDKERRIRQKMEREAKEIKDTLSSFYKKR